MKSLLRVIPASFFVPTICLAGGTLDIDDLQSLLQQRPIVRAFLLSSLEMNSSAYAEIRLGFHFKHLGGARLGPYSIQARPKSPKDAGSMQVILCTTYRFLDESGKVIKQGSDHEFDAVAVEEKLTAVMLREENDDDVRPVCPAS